MPGFDGTGPRGFGPGTGRGLGPCGRGYRWGFGRGYRWGYPARPLTKEEQKKILQEEIDYLKKQLEELD